MGKALELGSTQVRLAQGCVPFVFTTRIPSEGTEALATLQPALNQTVADVAASGCWMGAGACVVAKCLGRQLPSWAQEHRERFEEDAVEALSQDRTLTLRAATVASREDALRERLAKALRRTVARKGVRPPSELCVFSRVLACVHAPSNRRAVPGGPPFELVVCLPHAAGRSVVMWVACSRRRWCASMARQTRTHTVRRSSARLAR